MSSWMPEVAVIGAGVVGLACAAELTRQGRRVVILEQGARPGAETSARNSQVIHAGLYYPPGSLKARTCIEGRDLLYERCQERGIAHRRLGKFVVATSHEEIAVLEGIAVRAAASGATVHWRDSAALRRAEPHVRAVAALWSPDSGIVDAQGLVESLRTDFEGAGGVLALRTRVVGLERRAGSWRVHTVGPDGDRFGLDVGQVVNAAGLGADQVARWAGVDVDQQGWRIRPCKGDYFSVRAGRGPLPRHLVYPVPGGGGLGVHVTIDLAGRHRLGPDAQWVDRVDYRVDPEKAERFAAAVRRYLPGIEARDLQPEMAGIRPRITGPGEPAADFVVRECSVLGAPGFVQLAGIESPGLTAALSLARHVAAVA